TRPGSPGAGSAGRWRSGGRESETQGCGAPGGEPDPGRRAGASGRGPRERDRGAPSAEPAAGRDRRRRAGAPGAAVLARPGPGRRGHREVLPEPVGRSVAERVYLHIGLPKTATTYLQRILWAHEDQMRGEGLLLPGSTRREHLWASRTVRRAWVDNGDSESQRTAWDRMLLEMADWPGRALVSHEFFAAASTK